jgi:aspartate/methionine/tyrosine aminotransferase
MAPNVLTVETASGGMARRVAALSASATMAITARANVLRAEGRPVIGFGAGEPDFATPDHIVAAAIAACADPVNHKYSPAVGLPELRDAVASTTSAFSALDVAPGNVLISNGGKGALFAACAALLDPGDEVLLPAPYWVTYPEVIGLFGGVVRVIDTTVADGFRVSVDDLDAAVTDRTKALVFVSPSNPSGAVYPPEEVAAIGQWAAERGIWVITDEIYDHLVYGSAQHVSMPSVVPEIAERCVIINGTAKTFAMTGWRVGWAIGPTDLVVAMGKFQSHSMSNVSNVSQRAAIAALNGPMEPVDSMREAFDRRRRLMHEGLGRIRGVDVLEPEGAFYAFPSVHGQIGTEVAGRSVTSSLDLAAVLLEEIDIAVVPGEAFGAPGYCRLSFALSDDDLVEGLERWRDLVA